MVCSEEKRDLVPRGIRLTSVGSDSRAVHFRLLPAGHAAGSSGNPGGITVVDSRCFSIDVKCPQKSVS